MARKTIDYKIDETESRDNGRVFRITEMDVYSAEMWAMRAFGGMLDAGVTIPNLTDMSEASVELLFHFGLGALMKIETHLLKDLMDEVLECVKVVPQPNTEPKVSRALMPGDIEEIKTLTKLRMEVLKLHISFFMEDVTQNTSV